MKRPRSGDPLDPLQADLVAKGFETADETTFEGILVAAVEEVAAEVGEGGAVFEEVVADDEDRVGHGDSGFLLAATSRQATVLGAEIGVARAAGPRGGFD